MMHRIDIETGEKSIRRGHLDMGGASPSGSTIAVNSYFVERDGQPFIPLSGEFQFSRYPCRFWDEELLKMQAGGLNTIATYIFWIHHEPTQGTFDWSGDRNLRRFVELCARHDLYSLLRVGPFAHGECRNGGLPDWLYGQPFEVRSNDPGYLGYVQRFYEQIAAQVRGLLFRDGGPIIGIQIENEYMSSAAPWETVYPDRGKQWMPSGRDGADHIAALKKLLVGAGLVAPIYYCTAWGSPITGNDILPVSGGYAYPTWVDTPAPSDLFLFRDMHTVSAEPQQRRPGWQPDLYPCANAEMQGGIQIRYNNRPVVDPHSTEALALVRLAGGSNWLGYYIYHGGSQALGPMGRTNERLHPRVSYDFQAPIGEFGQITPAYRYLKRLHLFIDEFTESLASAKTILPAGADTILPADTATLRSCVRSKGASGFLFISNFQDHLEMPPQRGIKIALELPDERIVLPKGRGVTLLRNAYAIFPFNLSLDGVLLKYATAQLITKIEDHGCSHYFFFAPEGIAAEFCFDATTVKEIKGAKKLTRDAGRAYARPAAGVESAMRLVPPQGEPVIVTTLTHAQSEGVYKGWAWGRDRVVVANSDLTFGDGGVSLYALGGQDVDCFIFPRVDEEAAALPPACRAESHEEYTGLSLRLPDRQPGLRVETITPGKMLVHLPADVTRDTHDVFLHITYNGDMAEAYINGQLVHDHFNNGQPWTIGLRRFLDQAKGQEMVMLFYPLPGDSPAPAPDIRITAVHKVDITARS